MCVCACAGVLFSFGSDRKIRIPVLSGNPNFRSFIPASVGVSCRLGTEVGISSVISAQEGWCTCVGLRKSCLADLGVCSSFRSCASENRSWEYARVVSGTVICFRVRMLKILYECALVTGDTGSELHK